MANAVERDRPVPMDTKIGLRRSRRQDGGLVVAVLGVAEEEDLVDDCCLELGDGKGTKAAPQTCVCMYVCIGETSVSRCLSVCLSRSTLYK